MNLLHGDHAETCGSLKNVMVAILCPHEVGNAHTILAKGQAYDPYSLCTIDILGDSGRAEW